MNNISFEEKVAYAKQQLQNGANPRFVFSQVWKFSDGFATVRLEDKYNFINTDNKILREDLWFSWAEDFYDGFAPVKYNGRDCYIDTKGNLYDQDKNLIENRRRTVRLTESQLRNTIKNVVAQCLNEGWMPNNNSFKDKFAYANQQLQNGADPSEVFSNVSSFSEGFAMVGLNGKYNFINQNSNGLISDLWFDKAGFFDNGFAWVYLNDRGYNFVNKNGEIISNLWFDKVYLFYEGFARVYVNGRGWNYLDADGNILSYNLWFEEVGPFRKRYATVKLNGNWDYIDAQGNLYDLGSGKLKSHTNENRQRTVRLTESQLRNTIKNVVAQCLNKGRRR